MQRVAPIPRAALLVAVMTPALSCVMGPDYEPPEVALPEQWTEHAQGLDHAPVELAQWWRHFDDPILTELVEGAARQSLDVREVLARVREARAIRGIANAERFPSLDAGAELGRRGESQNTQFGGFVEDTDYYSVGFDAAWEIDLWGRVRRSVEAADAELAAIVEDARYVSVSVTAETAINYVELRAFQKRVALARTNVELQEETLALVRARMDAGLVSESDVAQAATNVETTRSRVPALEVGLRAAENRLGVLLGLPPGMLDVDLAAPRPIPVPPLEVAVGLPADLLRRRADVRRAERELVAENARIGVEEADLYPRLALFGNLGLESEEASDLFDHDSNVFGIGPSIRWNVFDAGLRRRRVEAQDERTEQALVRWERTVLVALEETENAMTAFVREQARRGFLDEAVVQARRAVELAQTQYDQGLSDFQAVLVSERALAELEDQLAQSDAAIATNWVVLYKALGGGWESGDGGLDRAES